MDTPLSYHAQVARITRNCQTALRAHLQSHGAAVKLAPPQVAAITDYMDRLLDALVGTHVTAVLQGTDAATPIADFHAACATHLREALSAELRVRNDAEVEKIAGRFGALGAYVLNEWARDHGPFPARALRAID